MLNNRIVKDVVFTVSSNTTERLLPTLVLAQSTPQVSSTYEDVIE